MSPLLRLEQQQKRFLKFHFEVAYSSFVLTHLELKREKRSYTLVIPSKIIPDSRSNWAKSMPVFRPKRHKIPTLGAAHTYMAYIREYPLPPLLGFLMIYWMEEIFAF